MLAIGRHLRNTEGLRGFYKGLFVSLIRVLPATCLTFIVYEHTANFRAIFLILNGLNVKIDK